jgi:hypothetical protein
MKRLCIIGDSQTSALANGWRNIEREFPDASVTFFSSHSRRFGDLTIRGTALVPLSDELRNTFAGSSKVEPVIANDYDHYIVCGLGYALFDVMTMLEKFRSEDQSADDRAPLSSTCYLRAMTGCLRKSVAMEVAAKVRAITTQPMTIVPSPQISEAYRPGVYGRLHKKGDAEKIAGYFFSASKSLCGEIGAELFVQPALTLCNPLQTLLVYVNPPRRRLGEDEVPAGRKEFRHMTAEYGELVLRSLLGVTGTGAIIPDSPQ